jgi:hypothetical protein
MKTRFTILKKTVNSRQMGAIERLLEKHAAWLASFEEGNDPNRKTASGKPAGRTAPTGLQIDSTTHTPALTSENSSPKTTGSPNTSSGDEAVSDPGKAPVEATLGATPKVVDVEGAET